MRLPILNIQNVVDRQLCTGCGACAAAEPGRFRIGDAVDHGRRPFLVDGAAPESGEALKVCPGVGLEHTFNREDPTLDRELMPAWGPVREVWEGYASAGDIRHAGSSGGAASALALYAIERGGMGGVLHTASRRGAVHLNETVYSTTRDELFARTGSRYAPASPCDSLATIEKAERQSVLIGKPCDIAAAQRLRRLRPELDAKLGLAIAFFCAGAPSTRGTLELLKRVGVEDPRTLRSLRYRGNGWPGMWTAEWTDAEGEEKAASLTYAESWDFLQRYRQWRCYVCPDHTGEFADIAVGDPWYRPVNDGEPGKSLIVARTARGLDFLHAAADAGYVTLETRDASLLPRSQPNLLVTRGNLWGRLLVLRILGAAVPRFRSFPLFRFWIRALSFSQKFQSIIGTAVRVKRKALRQRASVDEDSGIGLGMISER